MDAGHKHWVPGLPPASAQPGYEIASRLGFTSLLEQLPEFGETSVFNSSLKEVRKDSVKTQVKRYVGRGPRGPGEHRCFCPHRTEACHPSTWPEALQTTYSRNFCGGFLTEAPSIMNSISSPTPLSGEGKRWLKILSVQSQISDQPLAITLLEQNMLLGF